MGLWIEKDAREWAEEEFGLAELGNALRTQRAVDLACAAAERPGGRLTHVLGEGGRRDGSYKFLRNPKVHPMRLAEAPWRACARRASVLAFAIVPLDGSSLSLPDKEGLRKAGSVGRRKSGGRGYEVLSALAFTPEGTSLGVAGQSYWSRPLTPPARPRAARPLRQKETWHWLKVLRRVDAIFAQEAPHTRPWYQLDRGGDFKEALAEVVDRGVLATIRAAYNRRVLAPEDGYLFDVLQHAPVVVQGAVHVPKRKGQPARQAQVDVRLARVTLQLHNHWTHKKRTLQLPVVEVLETHAPKGTPPLHWVLFTTYPVAAPSDVWKVVQAYKLRWRIEEFHRAWKKEGCRVEDTRLRDKPRVLRWAVILASVATRAEALKSRSRETPDAPATELLSLDELRAALMLRQKDFSAEAARTLTMLEAAVLVGLAGGWAGLYSGVPPGTQVLMRGLERVVLVAQTIRTIERGQIPKPDQ
jgi:hypothetical protein